MSYDIQCHKHVSLFISSSFYTTTVFQQQKYEKGSLSLLTRITFEISMDEHPKVANIFYSHVDVVIYTPIIYYFTSI